MSDGTAVNAGYDDWLDAIEEGAPYYLEGPEGDGWLPPRRVDPATGSTDLTEEALPETGEIETFTIVHVPTPNFSEDAPFATAIARFGPVRVTGMVVGVEMSDVEVGMTVTLGVEETKTTGDRVIVFRAE
ncbi:Zn-ribbon domain-containing OB-fold protein [Haloarchaeobius sp. HME9146]|uniref:Zn-ribbon domain-containing OB-fold protein n=1 Tax=Haloarchaeobius sp. HME9146 TaxID=2978732 RepID=UPI0021C18656|nr:OB-fold domain-containing protein [Haloarchaeobius sp. HME9146]MCT9096246.1 OB-fold domain-containing protein [Haloarchaeobius sp. HME9146]